MSLSFREGSSGSPLEQEESPARMRVGGLSKSFGGTHALLDFQFELLPGEVHALVGGNGSGKSTFIKILAGVHQADAGQLNMPGAHWELADYTPEQGRNAGLRFVHQDLGVFPLLSLADNLAIGRGYLKGAGGRIRWRATRAEASAILERFHVYADPGAPASSLSTPQQAMLVIARALQDFDEHERGVLILDEPTASLPPHEAALLITHVRRLADSGHSVVLVTHRLDEVRMAADRVTAVRDGRYAGTVKADVLTEADLAEFILGRRLSEKPRVKRADGTRPPVLEVRGLTGGPIRDLDLAVAPGEIVGIAGLLGSGRTELLEFIYGARRAAAGQILIDGEASKRPTPRAMRKAGVAFVPEDRQASAVFPSQTVAENMTAGRLEPYFRGLWIRDRRLQREVADDFREYVVKASSPSALIETLSGGNQQKVVLARWLRDHPKILLLDEPDQGIDVGAREEIFVLLERAAAAGAAIVMVSSEFQGLSRLCHRVLVLAGGRIVDERPAGSTSHELLESVLAHAR